MNTKILALATLLVSSSVAQMMYNANNCATNKTAAYCTVAANNSASSMPVCAGVYYSSNSNNKTVTGSVGFYCLPLEVATSTAVLAYNASANVTVNVTTLANNSGAYNVSAAVSCSSYNDAACVTGTCCASRSLGVSGQASSTLASVCKMNSAVMSGTANLTNTVLIPSVLNFTSMCMVAPASSGTGGNGSSGNGTSGNGSGSSNAALIKYSVGAVASLVALTFF